MGWCRRWLWRASQCHACCRGCIGRRQDWKLCWLHGFWRRWCSGNERRNPHGRRGRRGHGWHLWRLWRRRRRFDSCGLNQRGKWRNRRQRRRWWWRRWRRHEPRVRRRWRARWTRLRNHHDMVKKRIALVRESDGVVLNVCVWDSVSHWNEFPTGIVGVECPSNVEPGWLYIHGNWIAPSPPEEN